MKFGTFEIKMTNFFLMVSAVIGGLVALDQFNDWRLKHFTYPAVQECIAQTLPEEHHKLQGDSLSCIYRKNDSLQKSLAFIQALILAKYTPLEQNDLIDKARSLMFRDSIRKANGINF